MRFWVTYIPRTLTGQVFAAGACSQILPGCVLQGLVGDLVELALEGAVVFDPPLAFFGGLLTDGLGGPLAL